MNNIQYTARVGLFFLLGVALVWVAYDTLGNSNSLKKDGYTLIAGFDNLKELKAGDDIRMAGVRIGSVEATRLAGHRAEAVLRIEKSIRISNDATATIGSAGLLGTNYISIDLGSANVAPLPPGAEIHTTQSADLNTIMAQLGKLGDKLNGALGSVSEALGGKAAKAALEAQRFQRVENWRARLVAEGPAALAVLRAAYPVLDETPWLKRVAAAQAERQRAGAGGGASRDLFRALRELLK